MTQEYLSSNSNTRWPFSETERLSPSCLVGTTFFADGTAILSQADGVSARVVVSSLQLSRDSLDEIPRLQFVVKKLSEAGVELGSGSVDLAFQGSDAEYEAISGGWYSFVIDRRHVLDVMKSDPEYKADGDLPLDPACVQFSQKNVSSLSLYNKSASGAWVPVKLGISGDVSITSGTNMSIGTETSSIKGRAFSTAVSAAGSDNYSPSSLLVLNAVPGHGKGRIPCKEEDECSGTTGNVIPDQDGDILISSDGCYAVSGFYNKLYLTGLCRPCCDCLDYENVAVELEFLSRELDEDLDTVDHVVTNPSSTSEYPGLVQRYSDMVSRVNSIIRERG